MEISIGKIFYRTICKISTHLLCNFDVGSDLEIIKVVGIGGFDGGFREPNSLEGLFREIFLIHTFPMFSNTSFNPPNWSVAVEAYAYVLFALLSLFTFNRSFLFGCCFR